MTVRCKMRVVSKTDYAGNSLADTPLSSSVKLHAVTDKRNEGWSKYTPSGSLELNISNPAAMDQLKLGACYYVDISEVVAE